MKSFLAALFMFVALPALAQEGPTLQFRCNTIEYAIQFLAEGKYEQLYRGKDAGGELWTVAIKPDGQWILMYWPDNGLVCAGVMGSEWTKKELK